MAQQSIPQPDDALNPRLFCSCRFAQDTITPVANTITDLRNLLTDTKPHQFFEASDDFGSRLRNQIGYLWKQLRAEDAYENEYGPRTVPDGPTGADRARLIAALQEAGHYAEAWCKRHGYRYTGIMDVTKIPDADAARQGWPDVNGNGWTPPWDLLGIEQPPDYWGKPSEGSSKG